MADREKLIAELANEIAHICPDLVDSSCGMNCCVSCLATKLDEAGYRKDVTDNNVGGKWIPVTERLPDSGKCVLIYSEDGMVAEGSYTAYDKKWFLFRWSVKGQKVTHWMPLPTPPKGE